jgi:hypothetical protein
MLLSSIIRKLKDIIIGNMLQLKILEADKLIERIRRNIYYASEPEVRMMMNFPFSE